MPLFKLLGFKRPSDGSGKRDSLQEIARRVELLDPERARLVAAFAAVLVRAARADLHISAEESENMVSAVHEFGGLDEESARLVVDVASELSTSQGSSHDYLATRELRRLTDAADRERLLHCLFAVCAADDTISVVEEEEIRQIASELGAEHQDYIKSRAAFRDKREVLKGL